ncbi:MAG: Alpha/Beta hydrolase protein [Piptocephalis tieghemiana]|nr:MAG: Alpha/Beta hydrolase protein [Piptocephalis tieghemiana]
MIVNYPGMEQYWTTTTKLVPSSTLEIQLVTSMHQTINSSSTGKGPTLLFAHGLGSCKEMWFPILIRMAKLGFRGTCITYDIRNHGESATVNAPTMKRLKNQFRCSENTADIRAIIRGWNLWEPLIGVGHSIGGCSILMAEVEQPYTFKAIVGVEIVSWCESVAHMNSSDLRNILIRKTDNKRGREEARAFMRKSPHYALWEPEALDTFLQYGVQNARDGKGIELKCSPSTEGDGFRGDDITIELGESLHRIRIPVLYICSPKSPMIPKHMVEENVRRTKGSQCLFIPASTHSLIYEHLDITTREIMRITRLHHTEAGDEGAFVQAKL